MSATAKSLRPRVLAAILAAVALFVAVPGRALADDGPKPYPGCHR